MMDYMEYLFSQRYRQIYTTLCTWCACVLPLKFCAICTESQLDFFARRKKSSFFIHKIKIIVVVIFVAKKVVMSICFHLRFQTAQLRYV